MLRTTVEVGPVGLYARHLRPRLLEASLAEPHTGPVRRRVCAGLSGDVLEIGFGSGLNLPHLPAQVRRVAAVEPSEVDVRAVLAASGLAVTALETWYEPRAPRPAGSVYEGRATA